MELQTIIFIGRAGSGKGTQAKKLQKYIESNDERKVFHLESGQRFRDFIDEGTYASKLSKSFQDEGKLQPEFLAIWAWGGELIRGVDNTTHLFIDGTPRRFHEAKMFTNALRFFGRKKVSVVYVDVSNDISVERMKARGRLDDTNIDTVMERLSWFDRDVLPVVDYFKKKAKMYTVHEIDGAQSIEDIHQEIVTKLGL